MDTSIKILIDKQNKKTPSLMSLEEVYYITLFLMAVPEAANLF